MNDLSAEIISFEWTDRKGEFLKNKVYPFSMRGSFLDSSSGHIMGSLRLCSNVAVEYNRFVMAAEHNCVGNEW